MTPPDRFTTLKRPSVQINMAKVAGSNFATSLLLPISGHFWAKSAFFRSIFPNVLSCGLNKAHLC